jgi:hypothetical protein
VVVEQVPVPDAIAASPGEPIGSSMSPLAPPPQVRLGLSQKRSFGWSDRKLRAWDLAAAGSNSTAPMVLKPAASKPRERPPQPENRSSVRGALPASMRSCLSFTRASGSLVFSRSVIGGLLVVVAARTPTVEAGLCEGTVEKAI